MHESHAITILARRFPAKRAFITGAGSGLGRAFATELAASGWQLGLLDVSAGRLAEVEAELGSAGTRVSCYAGDVASESFVAGSVADFASRAGGLDLMINNAGVAAAGPIESTPAADWRWIVDINLLGVVWGCQSAAARMRHDGSGLILNIASSAGFASAPQMSAYNATKAAVISLSETLAAELSGTGVQVSVAMPGFFRTALARNPARATRGERIRAPAHAGFPLRRGRSRPGHPRRRCGPHAVRRLAARVPVGVAPEALLPAVVPQAPRDAARRAAGALGSTATMKRV